MSLNSSILNLSETSAVLDHPFMLDESVLNKNVSQLDVSIVPTDDEESMALTNAKLSVTLDQEERDQLVRGKGREIRTGSVMNVTPNGHSSPAKPNAPDERQTKGNTTKIQEISIDEEDGEEMNVSKTIQEESVTEEESVIPIDDDDYDKEGNEDNSMQTSHIPFRKDMFSHLQPNKTETELRPLEFDMEVDVSEEIGTVGPEQESNAEAEQSQLLPDESLYFQHNFIELGRRLWPSSAEKQCYTKGCLWSPDGTCLLVPVHLDGMHVIELPTDLYTTQELDCERELSELNSAVHVKEGGMVYDVEWYPFMNSAEPASCCWLATRQHEPIHMWDAFTGELRCSYRGYDDVDEVESAISIAFTNDGQKIAGGYKKSIKIFDTNIPGRDCSSIRVKQTVSCFAFNTDNDSCVTTGSWNSHIYHYDLRAPKIGPLFVLAGHKGGITWLKYSAYNTDSWYLFSGARMDGKILQWDMRNYQEPVNTFERKVQTNQRVYFDLSPMQKWLISGDTGGSLRIWDMDGKHDNIELPLHSDCCNGASFHPTLPILSTSSGQYHFLSKTDDGDICKANASATETIVNYENCVMLSWFGPSKSL